MSSYYPESESDDKLYYVEFNRGDYPNEFTLFKRQFIRSKEEIDKLKKECEGCFPTLEMCNEGHPWNIFTSTYGPDGCVPDRRWVSWMVDALNAQLEKDLKSSI